ncbi:MAG: hypothetical protein B5M48_04075 [Candidatus Omnitrophica bacterium 4484_213]|nr:MAG: hypothetical protein B5M48_04075 [Candidatus Omnitrophica bacterium 4484_213]
MLQMIKKFLLHNLALKLISLFLAIILWFYVAGEQNEDLEKRATLNIEPPPGMVISSRSAGKVNVLFRGPKNRLSLISSDIAVNYKIEEIKKPGKYSFTVSPRGIDVPSGVKIVSIKPSTVTVNLDRLISKWLPIKPNIKGKVGEGYRIAEDKIKLNPNISLVEGPEKLLKNLEFIYTSSIKVKGYTKSFIQRVSLQPLIKGQLPSLDIIEVTVPIEEDFVNKDFKGIPLKFLLSSAEHFSVQCSISTIDITLTGSRANLDKVTNKDILAFVDVTGLNPGRYELPVQIKLPPNVFLLSDVPLAKVTIGEKP